MIEKFSDFESVEYLNAEGTFEFEVKSYELKDSSNGNPMAVFEVQADEGKTTIYHSLSPKARWSYNNLIKACLRLITRDQINNFSCDYETVGNDLIGKKFLGVVECETYEKPIKRTRDDGTFYDDVEVKETYRIKKYMPVS